ncbi:TRAP transporter substrate-binding protein [Bacilliculturomica massiliensis]|uniref:TRAP transporter substrate-binding protein n=1 Tax=Bacilliculturomica massiliensis TaxID=1917867 RepID=UPI001031599E|nr:TRAP transporter substrate-binding protein [Bacilliculturomica massiliensis]
MKMNRKLRVLTFVLCMALMLALGLTGCGDSGSGGDGGGGGANGDTYTFKIVNLAAEQDPLNVSYRHLEEQLEEKSDGRIQVEIYANKAISNSDEEQAEMIRSDMAQMTTCPSYIMAAMNSELKQFYIFDIPYLFRTAEDIYAYGDSEMGMAMREELLAKTGNIKAYGPFGIGWVKIMSNKANVDDPATAFKGQKIRTTSSEFYMGVASALGGTPTPISYGEAYTALQQKTVDGIMTATSLLQSDRFYEVQSSMACIDPYQITHYPIISNSWYESLPDDLKSVFDECMEEYIGYVRDLEEQAEADAIKFIEEQNVNVARYDEAKMQVLIDLCKPMWDSKADLVGGRAVIDEAAAFLEEFRAQ